MKNWSLREASWENDEIPLRQIRTEVFIEEQQVPESMEWDGDDEAAWHVLVTDTESNAIGTARILSCGQIGRMAVSKNWRNLGIGSALMKAALKIAGREKLINVFVHAQTHARNFYESFEFKPSGAEFDEAGIPHVLMVRAIR